MGAKYSRSTGGGGGGKGANSIQSIFARYPDVPKAFKDRIASFAEKTDMNVKRALDAWRERAKNAEKKLLPVDELKRGDVIDGRKSGINDNGDASHIEPHGFWTAHLETSNGIKQIKAAYENYKITVQNVQTTGKTVKITATAEGFGHKTKIVRTFKKTDKIRIY